MGTASQRNMYALKSVLFCIVFLYSAPYGQAYTWYTGEQRLTEFQSDYANSKADIFFLMDNSGSLIYNGRTGFADEKTFITSLLTKIKIVKPATRVAIIRFGTHATIDINYISDLSGLNNKCEFNEAFRKIHYTGVMTNMNAGFQKVEEILFGAQSTNVRPWKVINPQGVYVNKVVFLLTDGAYNDGGNPMGRINNIKTNNVELFAVGVGGVDQSFMRSAATTADRYFYYSDFNSFRELATHIRGDPYQPDYDAEHVPKSKCRSTCDDNASCGCGLLSGRYICICHAGFYGTGEQGKCTACTHGTYKKYPGLAEKSCTKCPENSGHDILGSKTIQDCKCNKGYEGTPASGRACTIKPCLSLPVPSDGYTNPTNCGRDYGSTCRFNCEYGFQLIGPKTRTCTVRDDNQGGAYWSPSDTTPDCKRILCDQFRVPNAASEYGKCNTTDLRVGTKCTYSCSRGYRLVGSGVKICRVDKTWSGGDTACEVVKCPPLNSLDLATVSNVNCIKQSVVFDSGCRFDCPAGYVFNVTKSQSATRYCKIDGTWDGEYQVCKDVKPPTFTNCPNNRKFSYNTTFRTNTAQVEWEVPEYEDNSKLHDVNHKVTLVEVNGYKSPRDFEIGTHRIHYIVTDKAGLQAHCEFAIEVKDNEAPYYTGCPQRIEKDFVAQAPYADRMRVTWEDPVFQDNSGKDPTSVPSSPNGAFFKEGQHQISYIATDIAGNKNASCQFEINLKTPTCILHKRPKNGALACQTIPSYQCQPLCREGYDFGYKPKYLYYCVNRVWMYWPPIPFAPAVWPDCARRDDPTSGTLKMASTYYFKGDCNDKEVQDELKERYMKVVSDPMAFPLSFCKLNKNCKLENIQIFCGEVDASRRRRRRRRSIEMEFHIQADFTVTPSNAMASQQDFQNLKSEMNNVYFGEVKNNVNNVNWKNEMKMNLVKSPKVFAPEPYCSGERGAVVGRCDNIKHNCDSSMWPVDPACLCNYDTGNIEKCIECPIGKYYDAQDRKCKLCSDGTFQDVEGQFGCKKCQPGFYTLGNDEKNFTSCKEICNPGYFSYTGLGPCRPCPLGYYSTDTWSTSCKKCPTGTTTVLPAAAKIEECGMKCASGTYSPSGVEPCKPCEKGAYQPDEGKLSCFPCKGKKSTYGPGAKSEAYCFEIDNCASNPCNNAGKCLNAKDDYECACQGGFSGKNCDDEVSQCLSNPCYSNAQCVDKIDGYECLCARGFGGVNCDEPLPQCGSNPCKNNAQCIEVPGSFECKCENGWTGRFCEVNRDDCSTQPCKNAGICRDDVDGFTCECVAGYKGDQCEVNIDECASDPCGQYGTCVDKVNGYVCHCDPGWTGQKCQTKATHCSSGPCQRGKCVEKDGSFECQCPPNYAGKSCEIEYLSDYDVSFPTSEIRTFSKRALHEDLHAFTVAFWMKTRDDENAGTPVSYAVKLDQYVQENGLVLKDYGNLAIQINNQTGYTADRLNDGRWHHVAVTWQSSNGIWVYYRDGKEVKRATDPVAKGDYIRGGGHFVLAQEQDWEAEEDQFTYNPYEAFLGDMSQMTVWNTVLSSQDIYNLAGSCMNARNDAIVISWADFIPGFTGNYKKTSRSQACHFSAILRGYDTIYNAILPSNNHKTLYDVTPEDCGKLCNQETGFQCRSFDYHSSSRKCYLSKSYRDTVAVSHPDNTGYDYYELNCIDMLGVENQVISDSQMSASSARSSLSSAKHARANGIKVSNANGIPDSDGGWIPSSFNQGQYLQVDLGKKMKVTAVETQGADSHDYWVTSYQVQFSQDGNSWSTLSQTFSGNSDNKGRKKNQINIQARYIKFKPIAWNNGIGMRVELYGCSLEPEGAPSDLSSVTASHSGSCSPNPCHNSASCNAVPYGYACKCPSGYTGRNCQTEIGCNEPGTPVNGKRRGTQFTVRSTVYYSCNSGYQLHGVSSITCSKGQWSGAVPKCQNINECSTGTSGCNHHCTDFPGTFKCSCVAGYRLSYNGKTCHDINECSENVCSHGCINSQGSFQCTCPSGMVLRNSGTRCEDKNECSSNNGGCAHHCLNTYLGRKCYCKHGYILQNDGVSCEEIRCPNPVHPYNGKYSMNGASILGNSVSLSCIDGYKLVGSDERICMADRQWSGVQPLCKPVRCVNVGTVDHANRHITGSGNGYNSRVTFICYSSYRLLGTVERKCDKTSTWSGEQPLCVSNYCPPLQAPAHGRINGFRTERDATVGVACDVGYAVKGTSFRTCQQSRQWSGSDPTCELVDCGDPGVPRNGYRHGNYYKYDSTINFSCKVQHHLEGEREIKCKANGKWSAPAPECLARSCGNPGVPYNGFKHGSAHTYGKNVTYTCQQGYTLVGHRMRTCEQSTAKWTGSLPSCNLVDCGEIPAPTNGFRVGSSFTYNKVLAFDCNPGYKLVGTQYRKCQENGLWSGAAPTCVATSCGSFKHGPSGEIESPNFPSNYDNDLYCTWKITVPTGKKVRIEFSEFKTEAGKDILYVFDTDKTEPIVEFSGVGYKPRALTSSGKSLRIRFVSNGATASNGFRLTYSQVDCGGMLTAPTGVIASPGFKGQYPSNGDCIWLIHMPGRQIDFSFTDFNTQQSYDRVEIYRGPKSTDKREVNLSGILLPDGSFVTTNYMYVRFTTSAQNDQPYYGFKAKYLEYMY